MRERGAGGFLSPFLGVERANKTRCCERCDAGCGNLALLRDSHGAMKRKERSPIYARTLSICPFDPEELLGAVELWEDDEEVELELELLSCALEA
jgi:hypothetical protein